MKLDLRQDRKVAVVTGAGRGLGKKIAEAFADQGACVIAADIAIPRTDASPIRADGGKLFPVHLDVTDENNVATLADRIASAGLSVDVLVNNAGIMYKAPVDEIDLARWEQTLAVNLTGPMLCVKHLLPIMKKNRRGRIINISSMTADIGMETYSAYSSTKAGLSNLTKVWAAELTEFGITVNAICPGWTNTPMATTAFVAHLAEEHGTSEDEARQLILDRVPQGRFIDPEEVAFAALFLASDMAAGINGAALQLDTGLVATFGAGLHRRPYRVGQRRP